jgi:hypothetical protein
VLGVLGLRARARVREFFSALSMAWKNFYARPKKPNKPNTLNTTVNNSLILLGFVCVGFVLGWLLLCWVLIRGVGC